MGRNADDDDWYAGLLDELNEAAMVFLGQALLLAREHRPELEDGLQDAARRYADVLKRLRAVRRLGPYAPPPR